MGKIYWFCWKKLVKKKKANQPEEADQLTKQPPLPIPVPPWDSFQKQCAGMGWRPVPVSFELVRGLFLTAAIAGWPLLLLLTIYSERIFAQVIILLLLFLIFGGLLLLHQTLGACLGSLILTWFILQSWKVQLSNSLTLVLYLHCPRSQSTWLGNIIICLMLYKMKDWRVWTSFYHESSATCGSCHVIQRFCIFI